MPSTSHKSKSDHPAPASQTPARAQEQGQPLKAPAQAQEQAPAQRERSTQEPQAAHKQSTSTTAATSTGTQPASTQPAAASANATTSTNATSTGTQPAAASTAGTSSSADISTATRDGEGATRIPSILEPSTDTTPPSERIEKQAQEHKNKSIASAAVMVGVLAIIGVLIGWFFVMSSPQKSEIASNATPGAIDAREDQTPNTEDSAATPVGEVQANTQNAQGGSTPSTTSGDGEGEGAGEGAAQGQGEGTAEGEASSTQEGATSATGSTGIGSTGPLSLVNPGGVAWTASVSDLPFSFELHGVADNGVTLAFMPNATTPQIDYRIVSLQVDGQTYEAGAAESPVRYTITAGPDGERDISADPTFAVGTNGPNGAYGQRVLVAVDGLAEANYNGLVLTVEATPQGGEPVTGTITLTSNTAS